MASNVVNMKLQYGVDSDGERHDRVGRREHIAMDDARAPVGDASNNLITQLKTLKAIRIGIVVRGEQWDKEAA